MAAPPPSAVYNFSLPRCPDQNNFFCAKFAARHSRIILHFSPDARRTAQIYRTKTTILNQIRSLITALCTSNSARRHRKSATVCFPGEIDKFFSTFIPA
ncbi:hypothetical protein [Pantoea sp. C2G6]|uniref:hypothetical protein n=1 Tax=Pantoea sp. C2G6 TaxID=3243084 RepID=UPI003EDA8106